MKLHGALISPTIAHSADGFDVVLQFTIGSGGQELEERAKVVTGISFPLAVDSVKRMFQMEGAKFNYMEVQNLGAVFVRL